MATCYLSANANSSVAVYWTTSGGSVTIVPGGSDTIELNNHTLTINSTITVNTITNALGGTCSCSTTQTVNANILANAGVGITFSGNGATTLTIVGNVTGGSTASSNGINASGTGVLNITGNILGGSGVSCYGIYWIGAGSGTITGNVTGGSSGSNYGISFNAAVNVSIVGNIQGGNGASGNCQGIINASAGTITITGSVTGGSAQSSNRGISNTAGGTVTISGNCTAGSGAEGATNSSTGTLTVTGVAIAAPSNAFAGVSGNASGTTTVGGLQFSANLSNSGQNPIGAVVKVLSTGTAQTVTAVKSTGGTITLVSSSSIFDYPAVGNVRYGTTYNGGSSTGTVRIPSASSVALGIAVDATTGTAVITGAAALTAITGGSNTFAVNSSHQVALDMDGVSTAYPTGVASTFREMVIQTWRRFFKKSTLSGTALITYKDDNSTTVTSQAISDDGTTQTQGSA